MNERIKELQSLTVKNVLRPFARSLKISNISRMNKVKLINEIIRRENLIRASEVTRSRPIPAPRTAKTMNRCYEVTRPIPALRTLRITNISRINKKGTNIKIKPFKNKK